MNNLSKEITTASIHALIMHRPSRVTFADHCKKPLFFYREQQQIFLFDTDLCIQHT